MAQATFTHEITICAPAEALHARMADLHNYIDLHPLIVAIHELPPSPDLVNARRYRIDDRVPLGPFCLRMSYTAAMQVVSPTVLIGYAWQFPAVHLQNTYTFAAVGDGTHLTEHSVIQAPRFLIGMVRREAYSAHKAMLDALKHIAERS